MTRFHGALLSGLMCIAILAGCDNSGGSAVTLAPVTGVVTYKSAPLAGATVTFMPEKGPLAMATTDLEGKFKLNTGAMPGCAVGPAKVGVAINSPDDNASSTPINPSSATTPEQQAEMSKKMAQMTMQHQQAQANKPKSLIPDRYKDINGSGLQFTVESDASKNNFTIELKD